jgi:type I restriction enzyme M protein
LLHGIAARVKKQLVDDFNLHTIVRLGEGIFAPYTDIPCNLLFFQQGEPTKQIWYYELLPPADKKKYSKTKPIQVEEFDELKKWWNKRKENDNAWKVKISDIIQNDENGKLTNVNLDIKNPNSKGEFEYSEPAELAKSIIDREKEIFSLMKEIEKEVKIALSYEG